MKTWRPTLNATVFFKCAPTARITGAGWCSSTGSGAKPRARRNSLALPSTIQATLSSTWRSMGRSCTRNRSAMCPSRSTASCSSVQIGSSLRLPLVATNASMLWLGRRPATASKSRWCNGVYGSITPSVEFPGATASATGASSRRGSNTIGASAAVSSASASADTTHSLRAASKSRTMSANSLSRRGLRSRSRSMAALFPASTIK